MLTTLLLVLAVHGGHGVELRTSCDQVGVSDAVVCSTCAGEGIVERDCWLCQGDGEHSCLACAGFKPTPHRRWQAKWVPPALMQAISEHIGELVGGLGKFDFKFPGAPKRSPKAVKLKPGELGCPAKCRSGKLLHIESWVDCKVCRGGKFRCGHCKKGAVDCARCARSGRRPEACDDCAGLGRVPDPSGLPISTCPWCAGKRTRACGTCEAPADACRSCSTCFGLVELPCPDCRGIGVARCEQCGGRGRYGRDKERCDACEHKGKLDCKSCDGGVLACSACAPGALVPMPCVDCGGAKEHPCNGCSAGAYVAWERTALWFQAQDGRESADAWLAEARRRCERRYVAALKLCDEVDDAELEERYREAIEAEAQAELQRLARLLEPAPADEPGRGG